MVPAPNKGKIALIANPASKNGNGAAAIAQAADLLRARVGDERLVVMPTEYILHAVELVRNVDSDVGCVVALGGDGLINEVANGLMQRSAQDRPALAVIPMGSGNDYAESLGMAYQIPAAIDQILEFRTVAADVGCANGRYFVETLSFGLDAAIALDTVERRVRTGKAGTRLYLESAIDQLFHHLRIYRFTAELFGEPAENPHHGRRARRAAAAARADGERTVDAGAYLLAVQIGPTYGGHFHICPKASITDGLFDLCWATPELSSWKALGILLRAKGGKHTGSGHIHFARADKVVLDFAEEPPGQIDGEKITGTHFEIACLPRALTVVVGTPSPTTAQ